MLFSWNLYWSKGESKKYKNKHFRLIVQDGRPWTHLLYGHTESIPTYRPIPPEEELRSDWTAFVQQTMEGPHKNA